jgi:hypothetical protein
MAPASRRGRYLVIDPAWLVAALLHADNGAVMTGNARHRVSPPEARFGSGEEHPVSYCFYKRFVLTIG